MAKVLIVYYSRTGNTQKMAEFVSEGAKEAGAEVILQKVEDTKAEDFLSADAIIIGSPTYYGHSAGEVRLLIDDSVKFHSQMAGKVGAAFSSAANIGGGNETAILDLLHAFIIHGMIIQGQAMGDHYGPVSIGAPDARAEKQCRRLGKATAELADKIT